MINFEALLSVNYGLYVVGCGTGEHINGFIANSVFQVTAEPAKFAVCCNKDNFSTSLIEVNKAFSIAVLHQDAPLKFIGKFGYKSGRDINKFEGIEYKTGLSGAPILLEQVCAFIDCKLVQTFDVGTHIMFIGEVIEAEKLDTDIPTLNYSYYREIKKGIAPKNAPTYINPALVQSKMLK